MAPFNPVTEKLYQGSVPDPSLSYDRFSMIVLCAQEKQPELPRFRGKILRPAFDDTLHPTSADMDRARKAAVEVAAEVMRGGCVLVTCAMGLNRSGLVTGLALAMTTSYTTMEILGRIRRARGEHALCNSTFAKMIADAVTFRDQVLRDRADRRRYGAESAASSRRRESCSR